MLREHDIPTYHQLETMLMEHGECCLIGIPGVGKTRISTHFIENYNLNALVISPRTEINNRWQYWGSKLNKGSISTVTMQNFYNAYIMFTNGFNLYIFDECHCLGAEKWNKSYFKFKALISDECLILGLSATPLRYFDQDYAVNNVSETVFNGHAVYCIGREEAIAFGIINDSKYVCALYDIGELVCEYSKKKMTEELRGRLDYAVKNQPKISEILNKHAPKNAPKKGIVYVDKIDSINDGIDVIRMAFPDEYIWSVHSGMGKSKCNRICKEFEESESGFIVNVDILSEGIHYEGINMIIMLRKTFSPTKFTQQSGRASNTDESVIFDFAANSVSVDETLRRIKISKNEFTGLYNEAARESTISDQRIICDYVTDLFTVLQDIDDYNSNRWTQEEDEFIRQNYLIKTWKEIAEHLGRTENACAHRACTLGIKKLTSWSKEEDEFIRQNYLTKTWKEIAEYLGRTEKACLQRATNTLCIKKLKPWSKEEDDFLRQNYLIKDLKEIAEHLGRSKEACKNRAKQLGIKKLKTWSKEEDKYLMQNYLAKPLKEIAEYLGRTEDACMRRANKVLGMYKNMPWTQEEDEFIRQNYNIKSRKEIAEHLRRSKSACTQRARQLGITKKPALWTQEEDEFIRQNYLTKTWKEIAEHLGRSEGACRVRANSVLGLYKI